LITFLHILSYYSCLRFCVWIELHNLYTKFVINCYATKSYTSSCRCNAKDFSSASKFWVCHIIIATIVLTFPLWDDATKMHLMVMCSILHLSKRNNICNKYSLTKLLVITLFVCCSFVHVLGPYKPPLVFCVLKNPCFKEKWNKLCFYPLVHPHVENKSMLVFNQQNLKAK